MPEAAFSTERYAQVRTRILQKLDANRTAVDKWISEHLAQTPSMAQRAVLEELLVARRAAFSELVDLDQALVRSMEQRSAAATGQTPQ